MKIRYLLATLLIVVAMATLAAMMGCRRGHSQENWNNHGHAHEETLQLTAYSDSFEVFAEADPFVLGQESDILAHFSRLENFKPLEDGSVTATLLVGDNAIRQTLDKPARSGVYLFSLAPAAAGAGALTFDVKTPRGASKLVIPGVTVYTNEHDAHHAAAIEAISSNDGVRFSKEQSWKVDFATAVARRAPFGQVIRATAQVQPSQGSERVVAAKTGGVVFFSNNNLVEGVSVNEGQALFSVDGSGMADNNLSVRFAEAESEYLRTKAEYERKMKLAVDNIVSQSDLLKAEAEFASAGAAYNNLRSNFVAGRQIASSPVSGFVAKVLVRNGEHLETGQPVLVVSQNRDLLIKAELQPRYFDALSKITSANIRLLNSNKTYTLEELGGRLVSYGKSTDSDNPLIPVLFQVSNKTEMLPGSFVELFIKTQTSPQAITVPNEAIVEEMGNFFVYVQVTPELFEKRAIKKGPSDGLSAEILEGVAEGERVVSKGAILLKLAQASGTLDAHSGHVH